MEGRMEGRGFMQILNFGGDLRRSITQIHPPYF